MPDICPSHPWIKFSVDMRQAPPSLWILLGEAKSKCNHLAGVPLSVSVANNLHQVFLAKGVHATAAIEGNTLTEERVLEIVRSGGKHVQGESYEEREIKNIVDATNGILDQVERVGVTPLRVSEIKEYHRKILMGLRVEEHVVPGEFSKVQVGVPGYRGVSADQYEPMMQRLCEWLNGPDFRSAPDETIVYGLLKAVLAHLYLVWIHPFGDGNGRTARLLEGRILLEAGCPSAAFHLLSDHYNRTRPTYYKELAKASNSGGDVIPFLTYAIEGFTNSIREQLLVVKNQQWAVSWINYIHDYFRNRRTKADKRQRDLVLALTLSGEGVTREQARRISPVVAEEYALLTDKTVYRDLEALRLAGLVRRTGDKYVANRELILQFLPRARKGDVEAQLEMAAQMGPFLEQETSGNEGFGTDRAA